MIIDLLILCEGITDQALIGCYIEDISEWKFCKKIKNNPFVNAEITWYKNQEGHFLGIWNANGVDNFNNSINTICKRESYEHCISKLLIVTDNDDEKVELERLNSICKIIKQNLDGQFGEENILPNQYYNYTWNGNFGISNIQIGYLLVPLEGHGALETFMLDALSENMPEKKEVIEQVKQFLKDFKSKTYLVSRRMRIKAELGVSLSIMNPDKSFLIMKELIDSVDWKKYQATYEQFKMIRESL